MPRLCTISLKYHPRQWVDCSDLIYFEGSSGCLCKSHQRKLVDGSDPLYFDLATQMLAQDNFVAPVRNDLNNPPTSESCENSKLDATALCRGDSRLLLQERPKNFQRCHGLVPWSFTLNACGTSAEVLAGTVSLHGTRPWHPQRVLLTYFVAASVKLHGARPWHLLSSHTVSSVGGI